MKALERPPSPHEAGFLVRYVIPEITETLVPRPISAVNVTPAYLFRNVSGPSGFPNYPVMSAHTNFNPIDRKIKINNRVDFSLYGLAKERLRVDMERLNLG